MFLSFELGTRGAHCHFFLSLSPTELCVYIPHSSSFLAMTTCLMPTNPCSHIPDQQSKQSTFPRNIFNPKPVISSC